MNPKTHFVTMQKSQAGHRNERVHKQDFQLAADSRILGLEIRGQRILNGGTSMSVMVNGGTGNRGADFGYMDIVAEFGSVIPSIQLSDYLWRYVDKKHTTEQFMRDEAWRKHLIAEMWYRSVHVES